MTESESAALPFGYSPMLTVTVQLSATNPNYTVSFWKKQALFFFSRNFFYFSIRFAVRNTLCECVRAIQLGFSRKKHCFALLMLHIASKNTSGFRRVCTDNNFPKCFKKHFSKRRSRRVAAGALFLRPPGSNPAAPGTFFICVCQTGGR